MRYLKRYWNEVRGDEHDDWGHSWWYFEIDSEGNVLRQVEEYEEGKISRYDETKIEDKFGGLAQVPIVDSEYDSLINYTEIPKSEFEEMWRKVN